MSDLNIIKPQNVQGIINKFCLTIGMLPTSYKLSLTYEEQILAIGRYLEEEVYPAINNNAEALLELQNLYQDLKDYVDNYFEDLDIQEEINNKLDEMVEDGTFNEIINHELFDELNVKIENDVEYHFIKTGSLQGDCILIKTKEHAYLNDLSKSTNYLNIANYLNLIGVTHLDGIIISHFHYDHIGGAGGEGFIGLINSSFVNETTQIYLPTTPDFAQFINDTATPASDVVGRVTAMMNAVINNANARGLTINYMTTNDVLEIDGIKIRFLNCSSEQYDNYYNITQTFDSGLHYCTNYNNFSMVLEISNISNTTLLTGDIELKAEEILAPFINRKITLKKISHHGVNKYANSNYLYKTNCKINIYCNTENDTINSGRMADIASNLINQNLVYSTEYNGTVCFIDTGHNVYSNNSLSQKIYEYANGTVGFQYLGIDNFKNLGLISYNNDIKENDDLNDYTRVGDYTCTSSAIAQTVLNKPDITSGFKLTVEYTTSNERIIQRIFFNNPTYFEYVRYYTGTWSNWNRIKSDEKAMLTHNTNITIDNTSYNKLPFSSIISNTENFELSENGIKCLHAGDYLISANLSIGGSSLVANDRLILGIAVNGTNQFSVQQDAIGKQENLTVANYFIHLSTNDVVTLNYRNYTAGRGIVVANQCYLSISS